MVDQDSVFINAGAVVLLSSTLLEQERQDVLNSVLFAQLVANKKYPGFDRADGWYETYQGVLKDSWLQRSVAWDSFAVDDASKRAMVNWVENRLEATSARTIAHVMRAFNDIAHVPGNHPAIERLREQTLRPENDGDGHSPASCNVRLQIIVARQGVLMDSLFVEFRTTKQGANYPLDYLFSTDEVQGDIDLRWFHANLSPVLYGSIREAVVRKLGGRAANNIFAVDVQAGEVPLKPGASL
ncbi:hypothetical protein [Pseudomonas sp. ANT_J28]|uniref:hypothetical protein n=1 Tax=Pseudomonas sp. ANT_J28 TaxID=2597352 RepID=UPI0011F3A25B|nr:hypothetical protein [Pseudomonas sp. ANT_J28]KAA0982428.1 hypothetical protein FQ187_15825 [Pseudomonas sp. ANT_J28]